MRSIALDTDPDSEFLGDFAVVDGRGVLNNGTEVTAQRLGIGLKFFAGEWFLDTTKGIRFLQEIAGKDFDPVALNVVYTEKILSTPGVAELQAPVQFDFDNESRDLDIAFVAIDDSGNAIPVELVVP